MNELNNGLLYSYTDSFNVYSQSGRCYAMLHNRQCNPEYIKLLHKHEWDNQKPNAICYMLMKCTVYCHSICNGYKYYVTPTVDYSIAFNERKCMFQ